MTPTLTPGLKNLGLKIPTLVLKIPDSDYETEPKIGHRLLLVL